VERQWLHTQQSNINRNGIEKTEGREMEVEIEEMQLEICSPSLIPSSSPHSSNKVDGREAITNEWRGATMQHNNQ
jgi:hypothetical protein